MRTYKARTKTQAIWDTKLAEVMKICRGCLVAERRMISVKLFEDIFKDLIGIVIFPNDGLPQWLCYECCSLLHKYNKFRNKLIQSHLMLSQYVLKKQPVSLSDNASPHLTQSSVQYCEFPSIPTEQVDEEINGALIGETDTPVATEIVKEEIVFSDNEDYIVEEECREETPQIEYAQKLLEDILKKTCTVKLHRLQLTEARKASRRKSRVESEAMRQSLRARIQFDDDIGLHIPEEPEPGTKGKDPKDTTSDAKNNEQVVSIDEATKSICNIVIKNEPINNDDIFDQIIDRGIMLPESDVNKEIVIVNVKSEYNVNKNSFDNVTQGRDLKDTTSDSKNNEQVVSIDEETKSICNIVIKNEPLSNDDILDQINDNSTMLPESDVYKDIVIVNVKSESNVNNNSLDNVNSYTCNKCNKYFDSKIVLTAHHLQHLSYKCDVCMEEFSCSSDFNVHVRLHTTGKPSNTDTWMKPESRNEYVKKHILVHTGDKPFKCEICMKCFSKYKLVRDHILRIHTGYKPHKCDLCTKGFTTRSSLDAHKRIHTGDKPYKCDICLKRYGCKYSLKEHVRIHTGEKPYKCNVCMKSFRMKCLLKTHMHTHNKDGLSYKCDICTKGFKTKRGIKYHISIHNNDNKLYKCDICMKSFSSISRLKKHVRIHSNKPYKCDECMISFDFQNDFNKHILTHTDATVIPAVGYDVDMKGPIYLHNLY